MAGKRRTPATTPGLLPAGAAAALRRRLVQAAGALLVLAVALTVAALVTVTPGDPSLNTAADGAAGNALGRPGAAVADMLLQSVGVAVAAPLLVLAIWGGHLAVRARLLPLAWLRLVAAVTGLLLLAAVAAAMPAPEAWPVAAGLGGFAGLLLLERLADAVAAAGLGGWAVLLAVPLLAAVGVALTGWALGLRWRDWREAARLAWRLMRGAARFLRRPRLAMPIGGRRARRQGERREPLLEPPAAATAPRRGNDIVAPKKPRAQPGKREREAREPALDLGQRGGGFALPPLSLLAPPPQGGRERKVDEAGLAQNARMLESVLRDFGVSGEIVKVRPGPVVTLYELEPAPGTKTARVIGLADDIARSMSAVSVRIAVVPGRTVIGIELPNSRRETVFLRQLLAGTDYERSAGKLTLVLGKDIGGGSVLVDLAKMPHLLIAGTTGSGKSVAINAMILSLLYRLPPDQCRLIMIDPKMLELSVYDGIPHLLAPVVTEPPKAVVALKWAVREMEDRYRAMSQLGVRNIAGYNQRIAEAQRRGEVITRRVQTGFDPDSGKPIVEEQELALEHLPYIVVVVDEMADLMLVAGKDIEAAVQRLAQMARAAGIHLIMATQRPSVDVITGTIKANFPTRISFQVTSKIDSRTILGEQGAEQLLGQGDMLYMAPGGRITRVHGPFVSDDEVEAVAAHLRAQGEPTYVESVTEENAEDGPAGFGFGLGAAGGGEGSGDDLYDQAVALVAREGKASTSFVQRHLQIGYNRAARIIERMEAEGVVSRANRVGKREVLIGSSEDR